MYKIIGVDDKEYGPISADQLRQWISEGRINGNTKVQPEGTGVWKRAAELPELAAVFPVAPPLSHAAPITMGAPPGPAKANSMAVWAMITGIVALVCCQILGPVSLVLGLVALSQIKKNPQETGSGFAVAGVVLGIISLILIAIGIVAFLSTPDLFRNFPNVHLQ